MDIDIATVKKLGFETRDTEHYEYPRICRFQDAFDLDGLIDVLRRPPSETVEDHCLYLHVPFCSTICTFCNYFKVLDRHPEERQAFVDALVLEIDTYGRYLHERKKLIRGIHFGGGTPTLLEHDQFAQILNAFRRNFDLSECDLYSLEGTLKSLVDRNKIASLVDLGFNRLSFGVQTLNPQIRRKLGVHYEQAQVKEVCSSLSALGLQNFNIDLMFNLPDQEPEEVLRDIDEMFSYGANNIDLYFLNVYPRTNIEKILKQRARWVGYNDTARQIEFGAAIYGHIAKSERIKLLFSNTISLKSKKIHRTLSNALGNNKYDGGNQFALGPSARGYVDGYIYKNDASLDGYLANTRAHGFGYALGRRIPEFEAEHRTMVMFPNFTYIEKAHIRNEERFRKKIDYLIEHGVIEETADQLRILPQYVFFNGNISALFQSSEEKQRAMRSYFFTRKHRLNVYNQDKVNIARESSAV